MDNFIPDVYSQSIYTINYKKLKKNGIKCLLFDLDNTLASYKTMEPSRKVKDLFSLLSNDFKIIIISNSGKNRLRPFKEKLNVDVAFNSHKPFKKKYQKIMELYHFKVNEIACIGDQLLTDILGANRMGFTSILVNPISKKDYFLTKINRFLEKFIYQYFTSHGLFKKGEYYE